MYPHERSLVQRLADEPFALIGVNSDDDLEALLHRIEQEKITWRSFWDGHGEMKTAGPIASRWNVTFWPTLYVLDHEGRIRFKNLRGAELDNAVDALLEEVQHSKD